MRRDALDWRALKSDGSAHCHANSMFLLYLPSCFRRILDQALITHIDDTLNIIQFSAQRCLVVAEPGELAGRLT
jgi:hypothetical protein